VPQLILRGALRLRVREPSPGLYSWVVTQLASGQNDAETCVGVSDHPYATREAAMRMGAACLQALKAAARDAFFHEALWSQSPSLPHFAPRPMRQQALRNG